MSPEIIDEKLILLKLGQPFATRPGPLSKFETHRAYTYNRMFLSKGIPHVEYTVVYHSGIKHTESDSLSVIRLWLRDEILTEDIL